LCAGPWKNKKNCTQSHPHCRYRVYKNNLAAHQIDSFVQWLRRLIQNFWKCYFRTNLLQTLQQRIKIEGCRGYVCMEGKKDYSQCQTFYPVVRTGYPHPLARKRVLRPPPLSPRGGRHSLAGEGVRGPNSGERTDTLVLHVYNNPSTEGTLLAYTDVRTLTK
jgi:hypothetical protein